MGVIKEAADKLAFFDRSPVDQPDGLSAAAALEWLGLAKNVPASAGGVEGVTVERTTSYSINTLSPTPVDWDDPAVVDDGTYWSSSNPERVTVPSDGWYLVVASANLTNDNRNITMSVRVNAGAIGARTFQQRSSMADARNSVVALFYLSANDYIDLFFETTTNTNLDTAVMSVVKL